MYGSVQLIVNEISTLPIKTDAPWIDEPTPDLNRMSWLSQILTAMLLDGTAYIGVLGSLSAPSFLPLDPQRINVRRINGRKVYLMRGVEAPYPIIEIPCMMLSGTDIGLSPVECARQSIGLGLASVRYGSEVFDGVANQPGVISSPKPMNPGAKLELAELWRKKFSRAGKNLPGVLDDGATWVNTGVTADQAQFLATRGFTAGEIAGQVFMVDPSELGIPLQGGGLVYQNLSQRNTRRITFTCMPHIRRIEHAFSQYARGGFEFDVDARLRGDTMTSYQTLAIALTAGFMTVDEVREILGLGPMPAGALAPDVAQQLGKSQLLALLKEPAHATAA